MSASVDGSRGVRRTQLGIGALVAALAFAIWLCWPFFTADSRDGAPPAELGASERESAHELEPLRAPSPGVQREASVPGDATSRAESTPASESTQDAESIEAPPAEDDLRIRVIDGASGERLDTVPLHISWFVERSGSRSLHQLFDGKPSGSEREVRLSRATVEESVQSSRSAGVLLVNPAGVFERQTVLLARIDPWPTEPLELVLPALGWVRFRVQDEIGNPLNASGTIDVIRSGGDAQAHIQRAKLSLEKGETEHCACSLGVELEARGTLADGTQIARTKARGPQTPGETMWIPLHCEQPPAVLLVRVMLAPDLPLRDGQVVVGSHQLRTTARGAISVGSSNVAKTDGEGWLRLPLEDATGGEGLHRTLELASTDASRGRLSAVLDLSRAFSSGETSLGEVLLKEEPLLAAGLVADGVGRPIAQASISCDILGEDPREMPGQSVQASSDEGGRFVFRSARAASRLRLSASASGFTEKEPLEVAVGSQDVVLTLEAGASLRGSVRVPDGMDPTSISVRVMPASSGARMRRPTRAPSIEADGSFFQPQVPPGSSTVELSLRDHGVVASVPDVVFVSGEENRDPRLQGLELCPDWRRLSFRLLEADANAKPLQIQGLDLLCAETSRRRHLASDAEGKCSTWITAEETAFTLRTPGYRPAELRASTDVVELRLRSGIQVTLPVEAAVFAPITRLRVRLNGAGGISTAMVDVVDGAAELSVSAPGRYELEPALVLEQGGATLVTTFEIDPPYVVDIAEDGERRLPVWRVTEAMLRAGLGK